MALPLALGAYTDITSLFEQCLATKSDAALSFTAYGQAVRWRQRAYYVRKLWKQEQEKRGIIAPTCPWDELQIRLDPNDKLRLLIEHNYVGKGIAQVTFTPAPDNSGHANLDTSSNLDIPLDIADDPLFLALSKGTPQR